MNPYLPVLIAVSFLCGSIPFGYLIARSKGIDIRQHGSRNIGATNVGRVLGKPYAIIVFSLDMCKGLMPVLLAGFVLRTVWNFDASPLLAWQWLATAFAAICGHMFPPWLAFKGGKGVATGFGALLGVFPVITFPALAVFGIWFVIMKTTRYVSLASCLASMCLPALLALMLWIARAFGWLTHPEGAAGTFSAAYPYLTVSGAMAALVVFKHRSNLLRIVQGTEFRAGERSHLVANGDGAARASAVPSTVPQSPR